MKRYSLADMTAYFRQVENTPFLKGDNQSGWTANFDWLMKEANMAKVLEGNYEQKKSDHDADVLSSWLKKGTG